MVNTRRSKPSNGTTSTTTSSQQAKKRPSSTKVTTAAERATARLEIAATTALGDKETAPSKAGKAYKSSGGYWADVEPTTSPKRKRSDYTAADGRPASRRKLQTAQPADDIISLAPARKRKQVDDTVPADDASFLRDAQTQLKRVKREDSKEMLRYLKHIKTPLAQRIWRQYVGDEQQPDESVEAYFLSSEHARALLASEKTLLVPVFVENGANTAGILDPASDLRPVEQLLAWFPDPSEEFEGDTGTSESIILTKLRQRFQTNGPVRSGSPWNHPDLAFPFRHTGMPTFLQQPSSGLLRDVLRYLSDVGANSICQDGCQDRTKANRCCDSHLLTLGEFTELHQGWRHWQGTVMLAEAGVVTLPHFDKWGFGTWLCCLEGQMGFGWLPNPSDDDLTAIASQTLEPDGRWRYKVLRAGEALHMPPGLPHLVFRQPEGRQTAGLAGHVVRRVDAERWVKLLRLEAEHAVTDDEISGEGFGEVVRGLVVGLQHFHGQKSRVGKALKQLEWLASKL